MTDTAILVEGLWKRYRLGGASYRQTLREVLSQCAQSSMGRVISRLRRRGFAEATPSPDYVDALRDVSLQVRRGEIFGVIGRNGAGKSTLLKILTRITEPTAGHAEIHGRAGSLLEVGTGFHSELTGRENIYLSGAVLGIRKAEIERRFEEIVAFADIGRFLDVPVKRYSSGMYTRLGFAVAAHLDSEILLVDEVLAVGDAAFQKKCLGKMGDVARSGRTILFVTHNMAAVQSLCDRVAWFDQGSIVAEGSPAEVVSSYLRTAFQMRTEDEWEDSGSAPGNEQVRLRRASVRPVEGSPSDPITVRTPFVVEVDYWNLQPEQRLNLSLLFYNEQGLLVFSSVPLYEADGQGRLSSIGLFRDVCQVPGDLLNDGIYRVEIRVLEDQGAVVYRRDHVLMFNILDARNGRGGWHGKRHGAVRPILQWSRQVLDVPVTGAVRSEEDLPTGA